MPGNSPRVGVTRFILDQLGTRTAAALYVQGIEQAAPYISDCRRFGA